MVWQANCLFHCHISRIQKVVLYKMIRSCFKVLRAIFCKNQAVWNSDFFKDPSFLHIFFLLWSIWIPETVFKFWWLVLKLWLIKVLGYFQQKNYFWLEEQFWHELDSDANIGTQVFLLNIDISWKYITKNEKYLCEHVGFSL